MSTFTLFQLRLLSYSSGLLNAGNAVALIHHTILSFQANTGLHMQQIDALKHGFDGFDTENAGVISPNQMQVIFKMMGNAVQVKEIRLVNHV